MVITDDDMAAKVTPAVAEALREFGPSLAATMTWPQRQVFGWVWPKVVSQAGALSRAAVGGLREQFGTMTLNEILDWIGRSRGDGADAEMACPGE